MAVFSPSVLGRLQPKPASMEKEVLPLMAQEGELFCLPLRGYWLDIGSPKNHLLGAQLRLRHLRETEPGALSTHEAVVGDVLIAPSAQVGKGCVIGPGVVIGPNVVVHDGTRAPVRTAGGRTRLGTGRADRARSPGAARSSRPAAPSLRAASGAGVHLERCTLLEGCVIGEHSYVVDSIIGWKSTVRQWVRVEGITVLGESVTLGEEIYVNGGLVLPHKCVRSSIPEPKIIM